MQAVRAVWPQVAIWPSACHWLNIQKDEAGIIELLERGLPSPIMLLKLIPIMQGLGMFIVGIAIRSLRPKQVISGSHDPNAEIPSCCMLQSHVQWYEM